MFENEQWVEIDEFPHYSVSDHGRIKHVRSHSARTLTINERGFVVVQLQSANSPTRYLRQVNHLVAAAFLPAPEYSDESWVWHIDGDLKNCRADNLKWEIRSRVLEWNNMHRTREPKHRTPAVKNNVTGAVYSNAFECALTEGLLESKVLWHVERQAAHWEDPESKYSYVFSN